MSSLKRSSAPCATHGCAVASLAVALPAGGANIIPARCSRATAALLVGLRWQAAGGCQRSRGAPRVADCLLHVRHPVGEIAGEAMPTNYWLSTLPEDNRLRDLVEPGQAALAGSSATIMN